jgi:hypothetical protein
LAAQGGLVTRSVFVKSEFLLHQYLFVLFNDVSTPLRSGFKTSFYAPRERKRAELRRAKAATLSWEFFEMRTYCRVCCAFSLTPAATDAG